MMNPMWMMMVVLCLAPLAAARTQVGMTGEPSQQADVPVEQLSYEIDGETLRLDIAINQEMAGHFDLQLIQNMYSTAPFKAKHAYKHVGPDGWIAATVQPETGFLRGSWFDAATGHTVTFTHSDHYETSLERRALLGSAGGYLASVGAAGAEIACGTHSSKPSTKTQSSIRAKSVRIHEEHPAMSMETTPVFYGNNGCFSGDDTLHQIDITIVTDSSFEARHGTNLASKIEGTIAEVNAVYEYQFNVGFSFTTVLGGSVSPFDSCPALSANEGQGDMATKQLNNILTYAQGVQQEDQAAHFHLFTDCLSEGGTKGIAWLRTLGCKYHGSGHHSGVSSDTGSSFWRIVAHEIGHGIGMDHSEEEGSIYTTAGIMGYSNQVTIGGRRAFREERGPEACDIIDSAIDDKCEFVYPAPATPKDDTPEEEPETEEPKDDEEEETETEEPKDDDEEETETETEEPKDDDEEETETEEPKDDDEEENETETEEPETEEPEDDDEEEPEDEEEPVVCGGALTPEEAEEQCLAADGKRLCTTDELKALFADGDATGCQLNKKFIFALDESTGTANAACGHHKKSLSWKLKRNGKEKIKCRRKAFVHCCDLA